MLQTCIPSMCKVFKIATFLEIFSTVNIAITDWKLSKMCPTTFPDKIRYLRIERDLTQLQFAKLLHRGFGTITKWEQGINIPKEETLIEICTILNINIDYFNLDT